VPIEVKMAKLSPTMESGQLVKWLVKVGDTVKEGDTLAEVQTDKAVMPMESFDEGTVARLDVKEGDEIALGQRVMVLAKRGEDPKAIAGAAGTSGEPAPAAAPPAAAGVGEQGPTNAPSRPQDGPPGGGNGRQQERRAEPQPAAVAEAAPSGGRVKSTPLARKVAAEAGVAIAQVPGSGPGGRIIRDDVVAFVKNGPKAAPAAVATTAPRQTERIPHTRMRKTIADRMVQSKQQAPEIHVTVDIRMDRTMAARERLNVQLAPEKIKLSVGDFVTKAVALALRKHPALNASYEPDAIVRHGEVNIGIAVALDGGLIVPVLANADQLGLRAIRQGTQALTDAARQNKLTSRQMMGGTFTISNMGMYGVKQFDAILNLPEAGILAVGATEARPVVENGQLVPGQVMTVTLTADHRAVDGATAAEFMRTLKSLLEEPAAMLL
jgi:pyruvate dehydrogenase E2 component (dihydrolipoamide acetyltransferase)